MENRVPSWLKLGAVAVLALTVGAVLFAMHVLLVAAAALLLWMAPNCFTIAAEEAMAAPDKHELPRAFRRLGWILLVGGALALRFAW